ncbi:MAG: serine/threonine-protein kinase [Pirellulales bacterium]
MTDRSFEDVLAAVLAAGEANDFVSRDELLRNHAEYADEIEQFLIVDRRLSDRSDPLLPTEEAGLPSNDVQPGSEKDGSNGLLAPTLLSSDSTSWTLGRMGQLQFPVAFGQYQLISEIDRGGMGIVFKARHATLQRTVALKVMKGGDTASQEELRRFRVEAEASAAINHPNIVSVFEVGDTHGLLYFTMAFIDGEDLASAVKKRRFHPREAARIMLKITDAIAAAHRHGIIHRDIKPSNILLGQDGEPYLVDFGLAKLNGFDEELTHTGQILGTPAYMPPEQARGRRAETSPLIDIYSLGAVLYVMLTGNAPFQGPTPFDVLLQVLDREPPRPCRIHSDIPRSLETICLQAMSKDPKDRYQSAAELAADLERYLKDEPIKPPKPAWPERLELWWKREPILVSHLCGIGAVLSVITVFFLIRQEGASDFAGRFGLLSLWAAGSIILQQLSLNEQRRDTVYLSWAGFDIIIYTVLIYFASPPRGLLLIGYPMMIAASGLFYRVSFVVFMTSLCIIGFLLLSMTVNDPITQKFDFTIIYLSGLFVLGLCLVSMIRRVRGLTRFCEENDSL